MKVKFPKSLIVTGQKIDVSRLTKKQKGFYHRLASNLIVIKNKDRFVVGLVGGSGSGKSVATALLKNILNQITKAFYCEHITIDAYHYKNNQLKNKNLLRFKGRCDTYNTRRLFKDIKLFKNGKNILFPEYSRLIHEPVENKIKINKKKVLLLIDGLWLLNSRAAWPKIGNLIDYSIFIESDEKEARENTIRRHIHGGKNLKEAREHYQRSDAKNRKLMLRDSKRANFTIPAYWKI